MSAPDREHETHSEYLPYLLNRVVSLINAPMQRELKRRGMTMTHWRVLGFLYERDGLIISELAERTVTDQATLSRALDRLQDRDLIRRQNGQRDSRRTEVHLCDEGRQQYLDLLHFARAIEDWAFEDIDSNHLTALRETLEKMTATLGAPVTTDPNAESTTESSADSAAESAARAGNTFPGGENVRLS